MSSDKIEGIAISTIKNEIWKTNLLSPFINDQDKEPSWDGAVYIYNNVSRKKDSLIGRVPIQVKGKAFDEKLQDKIRFKISIVDLRNYLNDGGAIYFVIYENHKTNENKIYYVELSPIRLKSLLSNIGKQKTLSVQLKSFPDKIENREDIFLNFFRNSQKQSSFVLGNKKMPTFNELLNKDMAKKIFLRKHSFNNRNIVDVIQNGEFYAYVENNGITVPVELNIANIQATRETKANINVNGKTYYSSFYNEITESDATVRIGKGIKITYPKGENCSIFNYTNPKYVRDIAKDLQFLLDLIENGGYSINSHKYKIEVKKLDAAFNREEIKSMLDEVKRYEKVLDCLNCKKDLEYAVLTKKERTTLEALYVALIEKKSVFLTSNAECVMSHLKVSNLVFLLLANKEHSSDEKYFVRDFFEKDIQVSFCIEKGKHINLPQYVFLTVDDLLTVDNLCLEKIMPCIKNFKKTDTLISFSLDLLEKLYEAYKTSNDEVYLNIAKSLLEWLKTNERNYDFISSKIQEILKKYKKIALV